MKTILIMKKIIFFLAFCCLAYYSKAQKTRPDFPDTTAVPNILTEKSYWGFTFNSSWTSMGGGNQVEAFFFKPSVGGGFVYQNYLKKNGSIGIGVGLNFQQRGAGIYFKDLDPEDNSDSTHRYRYRFNTYELPITLLLRSKKCVGKGEGVKLSAQFGLIPSFTTKARRIYVSSPDGFDNVENQINNFQQFNLLAHASAGVDINANSTIFQLHWQVQYGLNNIYKNDFAAFSGRHFLFGLRLTTIFR
jgi:hypothetical protein